MKYRKVLSFICASVMVSALLSGCGQETEQQEVISVQDVEEVQTEREYSEADILGLVSGIEDVDVWQDAVTVVELSVSDGAEEQDTEDSEDHTALNDALLDRVSVDENIIADVYVDTSDVLISTPDAYSVEYSVVADQEALDAYLEEPEGYEAVLTNLSDITGDMDSDRAYVTISITKTVTILDTESVASAIENGATDIIGAIQDGVLTEEWANGASASVQESDTETDSGAEDTDVSETTEKDTSSTDKSETKKTDSASINTKKDTATASNKNDTAYSSGNGTSTNNKKDTASTTTDKKSSNSASSTGASTSTGTKNSGSSNKTTTGTSQSSSNKSTGTSNSSAATSSGSGKTTSGNTSSSGSASSSGNSNLSSSGNKNSGNTSSGSTTKSCSHSYSSKVTKEATCTATGVKTYTCSKCGNSYTETIPATSHNWVAQTGNVWVNDGQKWVVDQAAYDETVVTGYTTYYRCNGTGCGQTFSTSKEAAKHLFECSSDNASYEFVKQPIQETVHHEETGHYESTGHYETQTTGYKCSKCGATK